MPLSKAVVEELTIRQRPIEHVRSTLVRFTDPLGMGFGETRFSSDARKFKLLYAAKDLTTSIAETLVRDRFEDADDRLIKKSEVLEWAAARLTANEPLNLLDITQNGLLRLGKPTNIIGAKDHALGRAFSAQVYDETTVDGILYRSRLTGADCIAIYDRAVPKLIADPPVPMVKLVGLVPSLQSMNVSLMPDP